MKALVIDRYGPPEEVVRVGEMPRPDLKRGEVLVKIAAAPIHPSDVIFVEGQYGFRWRTPTVPGFRAAARWSRPMPVRMGAGSSASG